MELRNQNLQKSGAACQWRSCNGADLKLWEELTEGRRRDGVDLLRSSCRPILHSAAAGVLETNQRQRQGQEGCRPPL